jgi:PPE-repeat protein
MAPPVAKTASSVAEAIPPSLPPAVAPSPATGILGKAALVGKLSVPQAWAGVAPTTSPAVVSLAGLGTPVAAEPAANTLGGVPVMGGGAGGRGIQLASPRYGFKPTVVPHPPAGG